MTAHPVPRTLARRSFLAAKRRNLLVGCALGAAAALLAQPQRAEAQAFDADIINTVGNVNRNITGPDTETITIGQTPNGTTTAIIDWTAAGEFPVFGDTYIFLPAGHIATFAGATQAQPDFAVLNRVVGIPVPIELNGDVLGRIGSNFDNNPGVRGGTILFSNSNGIIVGSNARFDVGSLVLTTLSVETNDETGYGPYFDPNDLSFTLGAGDPNAAVVTRPNSTITATSENSYVAMVAPVVRHRGVVDVNGSAAYVAAEDVTLTINNGIFDIQVDVGTGNASPLTHSGTTGGPSQEGGVGSHNIYMVAVPKNTAITALLSGNVGFAPASDVSIENGQIILSAGYDVQFNSVDPDTDSPAAPAANFRITSGNVTSDLRGWATGDMFAGGGDLAFSGDVRLNGEQRARLFAAAGREVTVGGDAFVVSQRLNTGTGTETGGEARAFANAGGVLDVAGDLTVNASGDGVDNGGDGAGGDGIGGTARVNTSGGTVTVGGNLEVLAYGFGGNGSFSDAGDGTGGTASVEASGGGDISVGGAMGLTTDGAGGEAFFATGGTGTAGTTFAEARGAGSTISVNGEALLSAQGTGGSESGYGSLSGATGFGGEVELASRSGGNVGITGPVELNASGFGGSVGENADGGVGEAGSAAIAVNNGTMNLGATRAIASGFGGTGGFGQSGEGTPGLAGGAGGEGLGGIVTVRSSNGGTLNLAALTAEANGEGGEGGYGGFQFGSTGEAGAGGVGGDGDAGTVTLLTRGGNVQSTGAILLSANGYGGRGGQGGSAFSSTADPGPGGDGGDGFGGLAELRVEGGRVDAAENVTVEANGYAGAGGPPGQVQSVGRVPQRRRAKTTARVPGNAGTAQGGISRISIASGNGATGRASLGSTVLDASAYDPTGTTEAAGGTAGRAVFNDLTSGSVQLADLTVDLFGAASPDGPAFRFTSSNQPVQVTNFVTIDTQGDIRFEATGSGGLHAGGPVTAETPGTIQLLHTSRATGAVTVGGSSVAFEAGTSILGSRNSVIAATPGDVSLYAPLVDVGIVTASQDVLIGAGEIAVVNARAGRDVRLDSTGGIEVGSGQAGDDFVADAATDFTGGTVVTTGLGTDNEADGSNIDVQATGNIALASANAANTLSLQALEGSITSSQVLGAGGAVTASAALDITAEEIDSGGSVTLNAGEDIAFSSGASGGLFLAVAGSAISAGTVDSDGGIVLTAGTSASVGAAEAAGDISITGTSIELDSGIAGGDLSLDSSGNIEAGLLQAGDDVRATAGGSFSADTAIATGLGADSEAGPGVVSDGSNVVVTAAGNLRLDNGDSAGAIELASTGGNLFSDGTLQAATSIEAVAPGAIDINDADAGTDISVDAGADADFGALAADGSIEVTADNIVGESAIAGRDVTLDTSAGGGAISIAFAQAGDDFRATAATTFAADEVRTTGLGSDNELASGGPGVGSNILVSATGDIRLDVADAAGAVLLNSTEGSVFSETSLAGGGRIAIAAAGQIDVGAVDAGGSVDMDAGETLATGDIESAAGNVDLNAAGDMALGNVRAGGSIFLTGGGTITALDLTAGLNPGSGGGSGGGGGGGGGGATTGGIAPGFNDLAFPACLDCARPADLPTGFTVNFFGNTYQNTFISDHGYITFQQAQNIFTPTGLAEGYSGLPIIAAFFADVDIRGIGSITYGPGTYAGQQAFGVTWTGVGYYNFRTDKLNDFQLILVNRSDTGTGNFDIYFNYTRITWETGDLSGGVNGFGGISAAVGYNAGTGNQPGTFFELPGSRVPGSFLDTGTSPLILATNNGVPGQLLFQVRNGQVTPGTGAGAGDISINNVASGNSGNISVGNLAGRQIEVNGANDVTTGAIDATGGLSIDANGAIDYASAEADEGISLDGASIVGGTTRAGEDLIANAASGAITLASAEAEMSVQLTADGAIEIATIAAGTDVEASGASIAVASAQAGGDIDMDATGELSLDNAEAAGTIALASQTGSITSAGTLAATRLEAQAAADLALGDVDVTDDLVLTASGGSITGNDFASDGSVDLTAADAIGVGNIDAGTDIALQANDITLGGATAGGAFTAEASGTATFEGAVLAQTIGITSSDIAITESGSLGNSATQSVTLTALATGEATVIGGDSDGPGYTLSAAEAGRITAGTLRIEAPQNGTDPGRDPDVLVRDVTFEGARIGGLEISTAGIAEVQGNLLLANATDANSVSLTATERLQVVTPDGSVRVRGADGLPAGTLTLSSNNIWAGSRSLIDQLIADPNFAGRDEALLTNDGPVEPRGYIEGGDVVLLAGNSLFVQNSGTADDFAGITVVENTLTIIPTGASPLSVVAFGRRINPDGSFVTGEAYFEEVDFREGDAGYTDASTFNQCLINARDCGGEIIEPEPEIDFPDGPDLITETTDEDGANPLSGPNVNTELVDTSFAGEPLIEEPVTSGADSILWDCDRDDDGDCDEEDVNE